LSPVFLSGYAAQLCHSRAAPSPFPVVLSICKKSAKAFGSKSK
jgi:hypothetical protein